MGGLMKNILARESDVEIEIAAAATRPDEAAVLVYSVTVTTHPRFLDNGVHESAKAAVHGLALGLGIIMGMYNTAAWVVRRQRHLFVNTCLYAGFCLWEARLVAHHLRDAALSRAVTPVDR
jgi:hypothetical protein